MAVVKNGRVMIMVYDLHKEEYVYIPVKKWYTMSDRQRNRYEW